jgi:hypothetical protein
MYERRDGFYTTSVRMPVEAAMLLKRYAERHGWSIGRALRESVMVAVGVESRRRHDVAEPRQEARQLHEYA